MTHIPGGRNPWPYSDIAYQKVGCALCHRKDFDKLGPMMFTLPPMNYPGLRDSRVDLRMHDKCHQTVVNVIGAMLFIGIDSHEVSA